MGTRQIQTSPGEIGAAWPLSRVNVGRPLLGWFQVASYSSTL